MSSWNSVSDHCLQVDTSSQLIRRVESSKGQATAELRVPFSLGSDVSSSDPRKLTDVAAAVEILNTLESN